MPQLIKRPNSPNYYARFQLDGKDHCLSTGTTNRKEAGAFLRDKVAEMRGELSVDVQFRRVLTMLDELAEEQTSPEQQKLLLLKREDMARQIIRSQTEKVTISEAWETWRSSPKKRNPSERTLSNYESQWRRFLKWVKPKHLKYLHEVTPATAEGYAGDLWASNVSPSTYNAHTKFLRSLFQALRTRAGLIANPWQDIPLMPREFESRRNLTQKELTEIFRKATGTLRYLFALGLYTGMRLGDCVNLRWAEVDTKAGFIEHKPMKTRRTGKVVRIPIHPILEALLKELRKRSKGEYLFEDEHLEYQACASPRSAVRCNLTLFS